MQLGLRKLLSVLVLAAWAGFGLAASAAEEKPGAQAAAQDSAGAAFSLQTPIEQLVEDPDAKEVLERVLPGLTTHRRYDTFKGMSLEDLQAMAPALLTDERMNNVASELAKLTAKRKMASK